MKFISTFVATVICLCLSVSPVVVAGEDSKAEEDAKLQINQLSPEGGIAPNTWCFHMRAP